MNSLSIMIKESVNSVNGVDILFLNYLLMWIVFNILILFENFHV
ncbi:Uncharacterized protein ChrSV_1732 [Chromobacterium vaccinii]|nr:Uncharacterized protein ChrSW_1732 [Chromobacterium vaccinii]QND89190.1 Uncharacterized protein ChrSV_1732 [Chromobacterium vaccinii]